MEPVSVAEAAAIVKPRSKAVRSLFITHVATPWLDGKHTVFGSVTKGQDVVNAIKQGDKIEKIEILDSTNDLFEAQKKRIDEWNAVLSKR